MTTAILIDDERMSLDVLAIKLRRVAPDVQILAAYDQPENALTGLRQLRPDVLFLDVDMPRIDGFALLNQYGPYPFEVIFTTAHSRYAIEAVRQHAVDFLLKPVSETELVAALQRLETRLTAKQAPNIAPAWPLQFQKLPIPSGRGIVFVPIETIVRLESDSNYTTFYCTDRPKIIASRTLREFAEVLLPMGFLRVHRSAVVNVRHVSEYVRGDGGTVVMTDGSEVEVSRREKAQVLELLGLMG
jgi:two-component system, LytTR family, response regulator